MSVRNILAVAFLSAATTAFAQSAALSKAVGVYADASAIVAIPGEGLDNATGAALALGVSIHQVHSVEAEVMQFKSATGGDDYIKFTPILATYKYTFPLTPRLSISAGASVGVMNEGLHQWNWWTYNSPTQGFWTDASESALAYGISGGISYAVTEHVSLKASVRTVGLEKTNFTTSGGITIATAGVSFRF